MTAPEHDTGLEPPAAAADRPGPDDRHPHGSGPRSYVTQISVPVFGDNGIQRLHARMLQPEPLPVPGPESEAEAR